MAPLKEAETTVGSPIASASTDPAAKPPAEVATRTQPVALEIPVKINGAHTVAGSDKREPFSESTQTVLVFGHGAVVRVATSLAPGQLVFLTNEKTKKEVVCQVLKSKSGGSSAGYVELQFTEPAPGFWGLRMPAAPAAPIAAPAAPRPIAPPTAAPKTIAPAPPAVAPNPTFVLSKPAAPDVIASAPIPEAPKVEAPHPMRRASDRLPSPKPVAPITTAPLVVVPPPSPLGGVPEPQFVEAAPPSSAVPPAPESPAPTSSVSSPLLPSAVEKPSAAIPAPPLHDYAKQIDALFAVPSSTASHQAPAAPPHPAAPASDVSSEQLKLEAARLQAQLGSMLFTETPAPTPAAPAAPKGLRLVPPADTLVNKVLEIAHEEKPIVAPEAKLPAPPARKPVPSALVPEEQEVKIPAWLAPLSQSPEPAAETSTVVSVEQVPEISVIAEAASQVGSASPSHRSETAVFGGQLLGDSLPENAKASSSGSKKGLWVGLTAAVLVLAAAGVWYLRPSLFASSHMVAAKPATRPAASSPATALPSARNKTAVYSAASAEPPAAAPIIPSSAPSQSAKNPEPVSSVVASAPVREARNSKPETKNPSPVASAPPAPEPETKAGLGEVHLAAPVVNRGSDSQQSNEELPSIDTHDASSGSETLAGVTTGKGPSVPVPVGGEVQPAQLVKSVPPVYPAMARSQHTTGSVQVDALIDASGNVADLKVISGPALLHHAALDAVKQWKYKPAMLNGEPTSMHLTVTVQFRAQ